jgi:uncharacterized membrane protein
MTDPRLTRSPTTLAWTVYGVQIVLSAGMAMVGLIPIVFSDSCGSVADEPAVCNMTYAGTMLIVYWIVLALLLVLTPFAIVRASRRGQSAGRRAFVALGLSTIAYFVYMALMTR